MPENNTWQPEKVPSRKRVEDLPALIKYILLAFLILLLIIEIFSGEFRGFPEMKGLSWFILLLKLLLIILLIYLIRVQRDLRCQIISPKGCTQEEPDPASGQLIIRVKGTAGGAVFGHYTLDINPPGSATISYPGGGASGTSPVTNGELGIINTTSLPDGNYTISLRVYPAGAGPFKLCTTTFSLLKVFVYISRVGSVQAISMSPVPNNPNPFDPQAELRVAGQIRSVGGMMSIKGAAFVFGCVNRMIKKYDIRFNKVLAPGTEIAQPNTDDPAPAWSVIPPLPLDYTLPAQYQPWTRIGPAATDLVNQWTTFTIFGSTYYKLSPTTWASSDSGRYSLLEVVEDTAGHRYFDIQHIWLDNFPVRGQIVKFQRRNPHTGMWDDIPTCTDLLMSFGTIRVMGLAWDYVLDTAWWPPVAPNDNFDHYELVFWKQFSAVTSGLISATSRVPALPALPPVPVPTVADAGELTLWNLADLDADAMPATSVDPANKIHRGSSCTYTLQLFVTDNSIVNDGATTHYIYHQVPVKIINDLT